VLHKAVDNVAEEEDREEHFQEEQWGVDLQEVVGSFLPGVLRGHPQSLVRED
jgi:hypothetical protein